MSKLMTKALKLHKKTMKAQGKTVPATNPGPEPGQISVSPQLMALLQSPLGILLRKMLACSVSLQSMAASFVNGVLTEQDWGILMSVGIKTSQAAHKDLSQVLDDMSFVGRELIAMHNDTTQAFLNQTTEEALRLMPVVMPENRMAFLEAARGSVTVIVGAPPAVGTVGDDDKARLIDPSVQLTDNLPHGINWHRHDGRLQKGLEATADTIKRKGDVDLLVVGDFDMMITKDVSDMGAPIRSRVGEVTLKLSRIITEHKLAAVFIAPTLEDDAQALLEEQGARVIRWNDEFGPEVFYGREEATIRREAQVKTVTDKQEEMRQAQMKAEAEANALPDVQPDGKAPAAPGRIILAH